MGQFFCEEIEDDDFGVFYTDDDDYGKSGFCYATGTKSQCEDYAKLRNAQLPKVQLTVTYTFTGTVLVDVNDIEEAEEIVKNNLFLQYGGMTCHNDKQIVDYNIDMHAETAITHASFTNKA